MFSRRLERALMTFSLFFVCLVGARPSLADDTKEALKERWENKWLVTRTATTSDCSSSFIMDRLSGDEMKREVGGWARVLAKVGSALTPGQDTLKLPADLHHFAAGELGRVRKLILRRSRIELVINVQGPVLRPYERGPFTLYEEKASCQVRLAVDIPEDAVKRDAAELLSRTLSEVVERFDSRVEARASPQWNGRERDEYPGDYDETLDKLHRWWNRKIEDRLSAQTKTLDRIAERPLPAGETHLMVAFAEGVDEGRLQGADCDDLLFMDLGSAPVLTPEDRAYEAGKLLTLALELLDKLPSCRVAIEEKPAEAKHAE